MARGFNKVILMGNLARDPEIRYTVDQRPFARFTIAVGFSWKDRNGEFQEGADFVPIIVWGPLADRCGKYLRKGSAVLVEGRIKVRSYEAKDGSGKRYSTDVEASEVSFIGSKRTGDDAGSGGGYSAAPGARESAPAGRSVREKGFSDEDYFPTDISEMELDEGSPEADIPF